MIDPNALFSDDEIRQILARAAARQNDSEQRQLGERSGITLGALQEIARDAGLDPLHIEAAASDVLLRRDTVPVKTRLGFPTELRAQRLVGSGVSDAEWERIVVDLRRTFRSSGTVSQFGPVREWISGNEASGSAVHIRLEPADGGTRMTINQSTKMMSQLVYGMAGAFGSMGAFFAILVAVLGTLPIFLPLFFLVLGVLFGLGGWGVYRSWVPRQEEKFRTVLDRAELIARTEE